MDGFIEFLAQYGYSGMFVASFIAGSVFPFSSETVMVLLQMSGADPVPLFLSATIGNVGGSVFNYFVGRAGKESWRERLMPKDPAKRARNEAMLQRYGVWAGILCFVPILGSAIAVMMGYMRLNPWLTLLAITIGKAARYAILIFAVSSM